MWRIIGLPPTSTWRQDRQAVAGRSRAIRCRAPHRFSAREILPTRRPSAWLRAASAAWRVVLDHGACDRPAPSIRTLQRKRCTLHLVFHAPACISGKSATRQPYQSPSTLRSIWGPRLIEACLAIDMVVAWRIFHLCKLGRETPNVACTVFFEECEWKALVCHTRHDPTPPAKPPTLREATRMVAALGGFLGRRSDGEPGTESL